MVGNRQGSRKLAMNPFGLIFVLIGGLAVAAAALDWEWFMGSSKARFMTSLLGRQGARLFYVLLGVALLAMGVFFTLQIIPMTAAR
jgi:small neutral amino acid transporter SnatA (MarC family)